MDLSIDFDISLPILTDWKGDSYNIILVNWLTKIVYYEPVKVTIDTPGLTKVIIDMIVRHHDLPDSIVIDRGLLFTLKF